MPYTVPTTEQFLERFPEFDNQDLDDQIEIAINDAADQVDTSWLEKDYQRAILFLAAHFLKGADDQANGSGGGSGEAIASESLGPISVSYATRASGGASYEYSTTEYGRRFTQLRRMNFPGVGITPRRHMVR